MAALIGVLIFLSLILSLTLEQFTTEQVVHEQTSRGQMLSQATQQEAVFFTASLSFMQSHGLYPANGQYIQVSDLVSAGLLPTSFSAVTPFGQTLEGWLEPMAGNPAVTDLYVLPTGAFNPASLAAAGLGNWTSAAAIPATTYTEVYQAVAQGLASNTTIMGPGGTQTVQVGYAATGTSSLSLSSLSSSVLLEATTGIPNTALGGAPSGTPAVLAVAPGQLGYLVAALPAASSWVPNGQEGDLFRATLSPTAGTLATYTMTYSFPAANVRILGWYPICPAGATILSAATTPTTIVPGATNAPWTAGGGIADVCIQAYGNAAVAQPYAGPANIDEQFGVLPYGLAFPFSATGFSATASYLVNNGAGPLANGTFALSPATLATEQTNAYQAAGLTYSYTDGASSSGTVANVWSMPDAATAVVPGASGSYDASLGYGQGQNNFWDGTAPNTGVASVISITLEQPSGTGSTLNTYTLASFSFYIWTGSSAATWSSLNLPTPVSTDSASGYAGLPWISGLQLSPYAACPSTTTLDTNVLATNCSAGPATALRGQGAMLWYYAGAAGSVAPAALTLGSATTASPLQFRAPDLSNALYYFSVTIPAALQAALH